MTTLLVLALTDSLATAWPRLAEAAGVSLTVISDAADLRPGAAMACVVAGGGAEAELAATLVALRGAAMPLAAVGTVADHRLAAAVVRAGADDYFALPGDTLALEGWVRAAAVAATRRDDGAAFSAVESARHGFDGMLGRSPALVSALARAEKVRRHGQATVLLTGETGTGKELLARAIHFGSPRRARPFVEVNCAAIPDALLESELFGHEKGAFTSASAAKPGLFEVADGGTIFLDEIGHLALPLQAKLLRALQEGVIRRVGATRAIAVDLRVIAATHVDLAAAVSRGEFREDLFYRLNVVPIELPPLRQRDGDVVLLAEHFLATFAAEYGVPGAHFTPEALDRLRRHQWPGNIRELRNSVERAVLLADGPIIDASAVPDGVTAASSRVTASGGTSPIPFPAAMDDIELAAAQAMLALCQGNKSEAARRLRISRMRLLRLLDGASGASPSDDASDVHPA